MLTVAVAQPGGHRLDPADDQGRHRRAGAPPGPAWALDPRPRGDGCRHHRGRAVVPPAVAGLARHHGRRGGHPQRPLRAPADPADVVPRPLAVGPAAVANHERPELDSPVHVVRHGLPVAQRPPDHRGHRHPARDVLAAGRGRRGVDRARHLDGAALPAGVHPAVAAGAGPVRPRRHPRRGVRARRPGDQVVRPRTLRVRPVRQTAHRSLRHAGAPGVGVGEVLDAARGHPEPDADHRAGSRRLCGRPRFRHHGHARRLHHDDAVAGLAHRIAGLPAVDDAGVVHRREPDRRDLRRATRNHRRPAGRRAARRAPRTRRRRLPISRRAR